MVTKVIKSPTLISVAFVKSCSIVFISTCMGDWGGSEELWWATAKFLKQQGHTVNVFKTNVAQTHTRITELQAAGIKVSDIYHLSSKTKKFLNKIIIKLGRWGRYMNRLLPEQWSLLHHNYSEVSLRQELERLQPSLIVISQGDNFDGFWVAPVCQQIGLPYVVVSHKAHDHFWPIDEMRPLIKNFFQQAKRCFFVSQHNLSLTEAQICQKLVYAEVVRNPYFAPVSAPLAWVEQKDNCLKLACVGRLYIADKGQDILLKVLAQKKWKSRNLHVSFFGEGPHREALIGLASILGVENVSFPGFVDNIVDVWRDFHALIMPSRAEGLPLTLVEAMMCGRPGIVTDVGGMPEVVEDNITGFIAKGACVDAVDEALERAWERRHEWEQIGQLAATSIREMVPPEPASVFAQKILQLCQDSTTQAQINQ